MLNSERCNIFFSIGSAILKIVTINTDRKMHEFGIAKTILDSVLKKAKVS